MNLEDAYNIVQGLFGILALWLIPFAADALRSYLIYLLRNKEDRGEEISWFKGVLTLFVLSWMIYVLWAIILVIKDVFLNN